MLASNLATYHVMPVAMWIHKDSINVYKGNNAISFLATVIVARSFIVLLLCCTHIDIKDMHIGY